MAKTAGHAPGKTQHTLKTALETIRQHAIGLGATSAKIIPVEKIVIQNRLALKCRSCEKYGKTFSCPPYAPTPEEFRKIVKEYQHALFLKFKTNVECEQDIMMHLKTPMPDVSAEVRVKVEQFWVDWKNTGKKILDNIIELEHAALKEGFLLAMGFVAGSCVVCENCNIEKGVCRHPQTRRFSVEGVGVNVKETAIQVKMEFTFPFKKNPDTYALLLIE